MNLFVCEVNKNVAFTQPPEGKAHNMGTMFVYIVYESNDGNKCIKRGCMEL